MSWQDKLVIIDHDRKSIEFINTQMFYRIVDYLEFNNDFRTLVVEKNEK